MNDLFNRTMLSAALIGVAGLCVPAGQALAQGDRRFQVPNGCTAFLTVQTRSCMVAHHWTCEGDPEGMRWRVTLDEEGPFWLSYTDAEFRWLESFDLRNGGGSRLVEPEDDPASLSELLETGTDAMVFTLIRSDGTGGRFQRDYTGFDSLTGAAVVIDGEELLITDFSYEYDTMAGPRRTSGNQFVHPEWRLFFGGIETTTLPEGDSFESDFSPMEFSRPGEPGFLSTEPIYDCGDMMSDAGAPHPRVLPASAERDMP